MVRAPPPYRRPKLIRSSVAFFERWATETDDFAPVVANPLAPGWTARNAWSK
jgi:hypothetical protein